MVAVTIDPADPLTEAVPALDLSDIESILARNWEVRGGLTPLHGERDVNFRVDDPSGSTYVLKIQNPADSAEVVDFQTAAARHIRRVAPDLPISDVVLTRSGAEWATTTDATGRRCLLRLMTFLEGHHPGREELDDADLFVWGRAAASLGRALRGFFHPAACYRIAWDIKRLPELTDWANALDEEPRRVVLDVISEYEQRVAPFLPGLRAQVVHNDLSRGNVLVDDRHRISGITDFGDLTHTPLVCDLAVAIADVIDGRPDCLLLAESMIAGYASVTPLGADEIGLLADLVAARCAAALVIPAWLQRQQGLPPEMSPGAWAFLHELRSEGRDRVTARFAMAVERPPYRRRPTSDLRVARDRTLGPLSLSYRRPVHLVAGNGVELYAADGATYIDAYNNVPVLGHSHPAVSAAVTAQLRLLNTNSRYLHEAPVELAERLIASMPDRRLNRVLYVNSGSEANDLAWRIACFATGHSGGLVTAHAYHGVTSATAAMSPESWPAGDQPSHIRLVDPPQRPALPERTVTSAAAGLSDSGAGVAAMFVDGVFTSDGILGPAHQWTRDALGAVRAAGGLYVADEVQAGYGRTGDHLWSFAAGRLDADLVTLGKPMGNGLPVAAVLGRAELIDEFMDTTEYFSTFGGSMVACAAALAVLRAVDEEGLTASAQRTGAYLKDLLSEVATHDPRLSAPRGWGLAIGADICSPDDGLPDPVIAQQIVERMRERGVLIGLTGPADSTLKIRPPLVFTASHAERLVTELDASLSDVGR
jgi:4-aminobutyrate aminotransferase-like enzyme/Ser/Thr protein kinase RdoA (MazF antagonist)